MNWAEKLKERVSLRMQVCKACPEYRESVKQCKECGCFLPAKTAISFQKCPLGKW